jgi:Cellulose binding domain
MPQHRKGGARPGHAPGPGAGRRFRNAARWLVPARAESPPLRPLRAMLMTPWLAAGAGVVVAAVLALHVPHAQLTYRPASPGGCSLDQCGAAPGGQDRPASAGSGAPLRHGARARTARAAAPSVPSSGPSGLPLVRYQTVAHWPGGFTGLITVTGHAVHGGWRLSFRYPGARVRWMAGARWAVHHGLVTVTGPAAGQAVSASGPAVARIQLRASGRASGLQGCRFNGAACTVG